MSSKEKIMVNGKPIDIDVSADLTIQDVSTDMDRVASLMGFWGTVWATAEAEKIDTDAYYRQWRAQMTKKIMSDDPKLALPKIAAKNEADPQFKLLKEAQAKATRNVIITKSHYESFRTKASILQSKGAMYRAEYDATNMKTRTQKTENQKPVTNEEKVAAMREANKKG